MAFVERVKTKYTRHVYLIRQVAAQMLWMRLYNPPSIMEDYFLHRQQKAEDPPVDVLQGGDNLGEIDDLKYFNNKLLRGLRIHSYIPGP